MIDSLLGVLGLLLSLKSSLLLSMLLGLRLLHQSH